MTLSLTGYDKVIKWRGDMFSNFRAKFEWHSVKCHADCRLNFISIIRACDPTALRCHPTSGGGGPGVFWQLHSGPRAWWQRRRGHPGSWCGHAGRLHTLPWEIHTQKQKKTHCRVEGCHYHIKLILSFPSLVYWLVKCKSLFEIKYKRFIFCTILWHFILSLKGNVLFSKWLLLAKFTHLRLL